MAEFGHDLEDGESYLPSGILVGEEGWGGAVGDKHRRQLLQRQSFFSDGVGGLPCYPPELARATRELPPSAMITKGNRRGCSQDQRPGGNFPASRLHLQEGFEMSCLYSAMASEAVSGFGSVGNASLPAARRVVLSPVAVGYAVGSGFVYPFHPVKSGCAPAESCTRMVQRQQPQARFCSARAVGGKAQKKCGGTGVFLPLPRLQTESWKPRGEGDGAPQKQDSSRSAAVAKQGMSLQARTDMGLPQDWTY